ncbi:hypothetical protein ASZ90_018293 [hydrocarbon metagenome]|uniref:SpoVT-AbrB domain-containing protein n=1 Tax=hydrocarbon metagenome TaxID=938273 RepID=A0A0W8E6K3_9ZZZZ
MVVCKVQIDEENRIRIPDEIIKQTGLKTNQEFDIYIDTLRINQDLYQQLIINLTHEGIIIE